MSFYFYDYETFGALPKNARIAQFAGIRTDDELNILQEQTLYCAPSYDSLPDPRACNITGISPKECKEKGIIERECIASIHHELSTPGTITVGYNNIRFDDEITRYTLYRNFYDPYAWAWQHGNARWDLLDVVRMCYALKPETMHWHHIDGAPSFKLEHLTGVNGIAQQAHDALEDVRASIAIAKLIKTAQPKLFDYALSLRTKQQVNATLELFTPILHTSGMYRATLGCTRRCTALGKTELGNFIIFNLDVDPSVLLELSVEELQFLIFSKQADLPQGVERLDIKELHPNKSPMFVPNVHKLDQRTCEHLQIDMEQTTQNLEFILKHQVEIHNKITSVFAKNEFTPASDPEQWLYNGFLSNADKAVAQNITSSTREQIAQMQPVFKDASLQQLFTHFKARNYPELLSEAEQEYWFEVVQSRIQEGANGFLSITEFEECLSELQQQYPEKAKLWQELIQYSEEII